MPVERVFGQTVEARIAGHLCIFDLDDWEWLQHFNLIVYKRYEGLYHLVFGAGEYKSKYIHRVIMKVTSRHKLVDHKNGNGLDNRKENLRFCTRSQNAMNMRGNVDRKHKLPKGVYKRGDNYISKLMVNGREVWLGTFSTIEAASEAYAKGAAKYFGEFARAA